ncbi:phage virion morphogenesis protein [Treponema phagedenis]|uniref:Phage morphogenesis protein n=1 Tax=Treponema phagedenis TaxID=162 RepID=A0AAE6IRN8_TREPH|nr:phage virion morphogenesis protein [Treponema phagedenis]NVP24929.1 phage morphogenesis protein [Treponema phagedenis]QEJ94131.1 phage morphogenesis protein [Treponema phagedenis]QEJ94384.1 phage morphogenesis protein [Treponema phagedenis]QEJ96649.1 phage morphogenesis protein [Treponema phagedenis]QEJ96678.1 phage morphogenesis protein [Treponema phagedenis]
MKIQVTLQYDNLKPADSLAPLMKEFSLMGLSAIQKNIESNVKPENAPLTKSVKQGDNTLRDYGKLRASLTAQHSESEAVIGTKVPYARTHNPENGEKETVVRPKNAQYLCIPASPYTRTLFRRYGFSPRKVIEGLKNKGVSVYRPYRKGTSTRANVILAKEKDEEPKVIFILKKQITIPARPFMFLPDSVIKAMEKRAEDYCAV